MTVAFMHGSAQAVPVWLLAVPFVLLAAEELSAESRGRREEGESSQERAGAIGSGAGRAVAGQRLIPVSTLAFHGVVIASVIGAHWEMGRGGSGRAGTAANSRYVMSKTPASGGCGSGGMCGVTAGGTGGGCGSGGCGSSGGSGGCGSGGCGGGASVAGNAAKASGPTATNVPSVRPAGVPPRQFATALAAAAA